MNILKIVLNNDFEFDVDNINETRNVNNNTITININLMRDSEGDIVDIEQNITVDNMSQFVIVQNSKQYELEGYNQNIVTNKSFSKTNQSLNITAAKLIPR